MLRPGSFRVFDLVSVSFEFRFCACVLSWVEILRKSRILRYSVRVFISWFVRVCPVLG